MSPKTPSGLPTNPGNPGVPKNTVAMPGDEAPFELVKSNRQLKRDRAAAKQAEKKEAEEMERDSYGTGFSKSATKDSDASKKQAPKVKDVNDDDDEILEFSDIEEGPSQTAPKEKEDEDIPVEDFIAIERKLWQPLQPNESIVVKLPEGVSPPNASLYVPSTASWHSLRGQDEPEASKVSLNKTLVTKAAAVITFRQNDGILGTVGSLRNKKPEANAENKVNDPNAMEVETQVKKTPLAKGTQAGKIKLHWNMHSQVPGFYLSVNRGHDDSPPVHVHFFVNNFDVTKNDDGSIASIGVQHSAGDDDRLTGFLDDRANLEPRSKTGTGMLWATDVDVWRKDRSKSVLDDVPSSEPIFRHISKADLDQIRKEGDKALSENKKPFGDPTLSEGDWTIYGLLTCWSFTVYRTWFYTEEGMKVYNFFTSHMRQLFFEVARNGNFPFYKRQANAMKTNIHSSGFKVEDCMPPLPLVKSWRLTSQNQKPVSATPESWNMFRTLEVYPDARTKAFAMRLGIARNRANGIAEIQDCINKHNGNIEAEIWPLSIKSSYFVQMSLGEQQGKIFTDEAVPVPAVNTRLSIEITDGQFEGRRFEGVVVEDAYGLGMDLCASVYLKKGQQELPKAVTIVNVSIKLTDDGTPCDRQNAAMLQLAGGTDREEGVDLTSVLLEAPRTIEKVSSLADEVKSSDKAKDEFKRTLASYGLNQNQRLATDYSFTSESGLTVVWGPPGTGKTYVAMAALHAHVNVGRLAGINKRPVMVCAPSHAAVDKNLGTLLKAVARSETPLKICRFRGGTYSGYMSKVRTDNEANKQALADLKKASDSADPDDDVPALAVWEAIDNASRSNQMLGGGMHPEYEFNRQRKDFIEGIAGDKTSPWCKDARDYFFLKRQLRDATPDDKKEILSDLEVWEEIWNKRYFSTVDVVFCTNIGSAHPLLTSFYQPRILIIDEYAQESLPNSSTPAAAHMKSLELFWATGDPEQQGPVPSTKGSNECFWDVSKSPFEMLFGDLSVRERVQLVVQHRMRPDISAMVSRIWYKDALEDGQAVQTESLLEKTIKQAFAPLGNFWNGRTRFMVDASGPGAASTPYNNDKSLYNRAEADLIVEIVKYLLAFEPKLEPGQPILPKIKHNDIIIVTGYNGQVQYIKKQLLAKEVNTVGTKEVRAVEVPVLTTGAVQGGEAPIVLHSMVRNAPGNPTAMGFTRKSNQLCVNFSRAQIHHITVGNVRALMQSKIHGSGVFEKGGKLHRLGLILDDFYREKDMLSGEHMAALIEGREVKLDDSIFGKFAPPMNRTGLNLPRGRGRGGARGGDRGRGRGRGDPRPYVRIPAPVDDAGSALADTLFTLSVKESKQRRDAERDRKRPAAHEEADPRQPYEPPAKRPNTAAEAGDKMDEDVAAGPAGGKLEEGEVTEEAGQEAPEVTMGEADANPGGN